uniref:Uncharacterized protein n=1 Tax=Chromera velia CCMP2878 TaxID=1169474 RepID=A0A0G4FYX4_9ALVE|eukprot:Cvel_19379.t1-p1 / transcript=Cvel_19379.t1 / gene=Cvel_19379 / organism=Chromera_velia_CCMP2878 / gene_product=hypothetical protein / transcript_product=hypothetical protein / location=Cvel_scaffold1666:34635-36717(-) / protein_length=293 / sequence_SO=supercontig / SO=protein_coding / is_pseudo=false
MKAQKVQEEKESLRQMVMSQSEEDFRSSCEKMMLATMVKEGMMTKEQWEGMSLDDQKAALVEQLSGLVQDRLESRMDQSKPMELKILQTLDEEHEWVAVNCVLERYFVWKRKVLLPPDIALAVLNEQERRKNEEKKEKESAGLEEEKAEGGAEGGEKKGEEDADSETADSLPLQKRLAAKWRDKHTDGMKKFILLRREGKVTQEDAKAAVKEAVALKDLVVFRQKCEEKCRDVWGPVKDWRANPSVCVKDLHPSGVCESGPACKGDALRDDIRPLCSGRGIVSGRGTGGRGGD